MHFIFYSEGSLVKHVNKLQRFLSIGPITCNRSLSLFLKVAAKSGQFKRLSQLEISEELAAMVISTIPSWQLRVEQGRIWRRLHQHGVQIFQGGVSDAFLEISPLFLTTF